MEKREINGKWVYVFDSHNIALEAWAELKENYHELNLITLDHHTDTFTAFSERDFVYDYTREDPARTIESINKRVAEIDRRNKDQIQKAVAELRNDQQIDAAIRLRIFSFAFCFNNSNTNTLSIEQEGYLSHGPDYPAIELCLVLDLNRNQLPVSLELSDVDPVDASPTYQVPENGMFEIAEVCAVGCEKRSHGGDGCDRLLADQAIESVLLDRLISTANSRAQSANIDSIVESPYVLDLDLDYFRTLKSLSPDDSVVFYRLIGNAVGITIATEPNYVKQTRLDEDLTSEYALKKILEHVVKALA
jgi:hypothetical protein